MSERNARDDGFARGLDIEMTRRRRRALPALACAMLAVASSLGAAGCKYEEPTPPAENTGPGATVSKISIVGGPIIITAGDSAFYTAKAYDNANNELAVNLVWSSSDSEILAIHPSTGRAKGLKGGAVSITASAGSTRSPGRVVTVQAPQAYP